MERMRVSYLEAISTPWEEIERAFYIWSLDSERAKLEEKRKESQ